LNAGTTIEIGTGESEWSDMKGVRFSGAFYRTVGAIFLLTVAGGLALWWWQSRLPDEQIYIPAPEKITAEVELLRGYLRIDTSNPPGNEIEGARFLAAELARRGVEAEIVESEPGRASIYARIRGRRPGEGLMLLSHIDVVPADPAQWRNPPFAGNVELNQIWGRGALDMKSITIAHLIAFADLHAQGGLERDLVFLSVADEETGGALGMEWIVENRPDMVEGIRYAVNEGGITETLKGEVRYFGVEVGSKPATLVRLVSDDRERLRDIRLELEPLFEVGEPERVLPEVREYFRTIAPYREVGGDLLADIDATIEAGRFWLLDRTYRELTANTMWAGGVLEGEDGGFAMEVVLRNLPDEDPDVRLGLLREIVGESVSIEVRTKMAATPISSTTTPFFELLRRTARDHYGDVTVGPVVMTEIATDSRFLRALGADAYGFWPFPVDFFQTKGIHGIDERLRIDWFLSGIEMTRDLVARWTRPE
jgi:acetylornithine deacetylase/succinyl-diaminopimelate desuccinylase-like protein